MDVDFLQRVSVPEEVLIRVLDGESVILNLESEAYFGLDEVGTRMWTLLTESDSIQIAYDRLLIEYDVDSEQLHTDLVALIDELIDQGLLVLGYAETV